MKVNKERLIALTDGIIAIAATIMVLEPGVCNTNRRYEVLKGASEEWRSDGGLDESTVTLHHGHKRKCGDDPRLLF